MPRISFKKSDFFFPNFNFKYILILNKKYSKKKTISIKNNVTFKNT